LRSGTADPRNGGGSDSCNAPGVVMAAMDRLCHGYAYGYEIIMGCDRDIRSSMAVRRFGSAFWILCRHRELLRLGELARLPSNTSLI